MGTLIGIGRGSAQPGGWREPLWVTKREERQGEGRALGRPSEGRGYLCGDLLGRRLVAEVVDGARDAPSVVALDLHVPGAVHDLGGLEGVALDGVERLVGLPPAQVGLSARAAVSVVLAQVPVGCRHEHAGVGGRVPGEVVLDHH